MLARWAPHPCGFCKGGDFRTTTLSFPIAQDRPFHPNTFLRPKAMSLPKMSHQAEVLDVAAPLRPLLPEPVARPGVR